MTLWLKTQTASGTIHEDFWNVGESKDLSVWGEVVCLSADGDELDEILTRFDNIPIAKHKLKMIWRGEIAAFIWDNI
jgi:hypothetical protein